jgi:di/tricarboxylate transporter
MTHMPTEVIIYYPVSNLTVPQSLDLINGWLVHPQGRKVFVCANPHSLVQAKDDEVFRQAIHDADLVTPDGVGIVLASILLGGSIRERVTGSDIFGMGGPAILAIVLLNAFRIISWRDISKIHWEVVALYASACAFGKGLAVTGGALYLAQSFVSILPDFMQAGEGLAVAASIFTGIATNFISDGATVAAIGPITVPMATISATHPWMIGFSTAFASSFANMLIIGTPNNAIVFTMAKDPITGEQLVTLTDFLKYGAAVLVLNFIVLWCWTIFGYWQWISF